MLIAIERDETKRGWHWELVEGFRGEVSRLIFVDETGCNIDMIRRYGRAPKGERVFDKVPRNTPENLSLVCALAPEGVIASMELEGAINGEAFKLYVEHCLVPQLRKDDVVIMDNNRTHDSEAVSALIEGVGAHMIFLPPYSPDFNPIEQCFSKMKQSLRSAGARTRRKLHNAIVKALNAVLPSDVKGWFEHAGYWAAPNCNPL